MDLSLLTSWMVYDLHRIVFLSFISLMAILVFPESFAQHHGGEQAPPITFGSGQVTVSTVLSPADYVIGNDSVDLNIRFFDTSSNVNIENVSYRVQIFYGSQLVANQMFFDKDGELNVKIQPKSNCQQEDLWKCTKYFGESDPIVPNALVSSASSKPVIVGPVFDKAGEYTVKTSIIGATNPKTSTSEDINFETKLVVPSENQFKIILNNNEYSVNVKNYQEPISNFNFDSASNSFTFTIPFDMAHIEHTLEIKNNFEFPKHFPPFENMNSFSAKINDQLTLSKGIHYDTFSKKDVNIIHFMLDPAELKQLKSSSNNIAVKIIPNDSSSFVEKSLSFDNGYRVISSFDSAFVPNENLAIKMTFFDDNGDLASNVRYGYSLKDPNGNEIVNTGENPKLLGIELSEGSETRSFGMSHQGKYHMQIVLIGVGSNNFDRFKYAEFDFELSESADKPEIVKEKVPGWIKNNAKWWADGSIDDESFVQGIQFMIKNKIMNIPTTTPSSESSVNEIPSWVKNNAKWWADGLIGEDDFIKGIEFLAKSGIIIVN
jgi:hypothetical protein